MNIILRQVLGRILTKALPIFGIGILLAACTNSLSKEERLKAVKHQYNDAAHAFAQSAEALEEVCSNDRDSMHIRAQFVNTRLAFKKLETLLAYYHPEFTNKINGAAIDKSDDHAPERTIHATGFQVLEEYLFPSFDLNKATEIQKESRRINALASVLHRDTASVLINEPNVFEAIKSEVVRIATLGLAGFDCPISHNAMQETKSAMQGIELLLQPYLQGNCDLRAYVKRDFARAYAFLDHQEDFNAFDRMAFLKKHLQPIYQHIFTIQFNFDIPVNTVGTPINYRQPVLFGADFFNINFFAPHDNTLPNKEAVRLGEMLFYDPVLSLDNSRSCGTCHQPERAFTDGLAKSIALNGSPVKRNAPTLINAAFQQHQFYDSRVQQLENQVKNVIRNKDEMHGSMQYAAMRMRSDSVYRALFQKAYDVSEVDSRHIQMAIAAYIRALSSFNSRFDQYLMGNLQAMNQEEIEGFNLFMGKGKCGTCHFMPLFNGTVPPHFTDSESEVLGVPATADKRHPVLDLDSGKYYKYYGAYNLFAFKTPTVRNAALTAPYMHNGVYRTLEEVMDFYNIGGGAGLGIAPEHQTLPEDELDLSPEEQSAIIAFINTLTDTSMVKPRPVMIASHF